MAIFTAEILESVITIDSISNVCIFPISIIESINSSDSSSNTFIGTISIAESASVSDSPTNTFIGLTSITETSIISDLSNGNNSTSATILETKIASDLPNNTLIGLVSISEISIVVDSSEVISSYVFVIEPGLASDFQSCSTSGNFDDFSRTKGNFFHFGINYENERNLYDLLLTEGYNKNGVRGSYYLTTFDTNYDKIFGEDGNRRFTRKFDVMFYYELPKELELWSKIGIEGLDNFKMWLSKKHYRAACVNGNNSYIVPRVGDVINIVYNNRFYEIIDVGEEEEQFLQKKHSWELTVHVFKEDHITPDNATMSADDLTNYIDQVDIFDLSATIDDKKKDMIYDSDNLLTGW
jgi:hypothetical protein